MLLDDSEHEKRGFVVALTTEVTPETVNDMLFHAGGIPSLDLPEERCRSWGLFPLTLAQTRGAELLNVDRGVGGSYDRHLGG